MAPLLDERIQEPVAEALDTPLKNKPQLVAPEPGESHEANLVAL